MRKLRWDKPKKESKWYPRMHMKKDKLYKASHDKNQKKLTAGMIKRRKNVINAKDM